MIEIVLVLASAVTGDIALKELQRVISRHEESLSRIETLRATIEIRESRDGGRTWKAIQLIKVTRSGRRERIFRTLYGSFHGDEWREEKRQRTELFDPSQCRALSAYDPAAPPREPLSEVDVDRVQGAILVAPSYDAHGWSLPWKAETLLMVPHGSFARLLSEFAPRSLEKSVDANGVSTWILEVQQKRQPHGDHVKTYRLTFSPRHGDLLSALEVDGVSKNKPLESKLEVVTFWELGSGLFLPRLVRGSESNTPGRVIETEFTNVEVNQPIDDRELTLEFPEGAIVVDNRKLEFHLWGKGARGANLRFDRSVQ